jgi:hypothetical protein
MLNFIVLGQIPGTDIRLGFTAVMVLLLAVCATYLLRERERALITEIKKKKAYKVAASTSHRLWLNTLQPQLKFIENKALLVPEFALILEHLKAGSINRKSA